MATKVVHVQFASISGCAITWEGCVWASRNAPIFGGAGGRALIVVARFSAGHKKRTAKTLENKGFLLFSVGILSLKSALWYYKITGDKRFYML